MSSSPGEGVAGQHGKVIVISGPSGSGKTTICDTLLEQLADTVRSISATTRPERTGDQNGVTYEFLTEEEFTRREEAGEFIETAEYVGHRYGTPRRRLERTLAEGKNVLLEIDVQGGMQIAERLPESVRIFILPPDRETLRVRLSQRGTETRDQLDRRLARAESEIALARSSGCYTYFVVNDTLKEAVDEVRCIIAGKAEKT